MELSKMKLILASKSPRRKELLGYTNIPFEIDSCDIEEVSNKTHPKDYCEDISEQKGRAVFTKLQNSTQSLFVISSDTIVYLDGKIYGKPKDQNDARKILKELSGKTHSVFTAVTFFFHDPKTQEIKTHAFSEETKVTFQEISEDLLTAYLMTKDSLDKAGAYGIQGPSLTFIASLDGSYSNVVGFPLNRVIEEMKIVLNCSEDDSLIQFFK